MLRTPSSNLGRSMLENARTEDLFGMFETVLTTGTRMVPADQLAEAWGILFTRLFLSAEELIDEMAGSSQQIPDEKRRMLHDFIHDDCRRGGAFVLEVIQRGGNTDRAALMIIASPEDLAGVVWQGSTAIHMLAITCDKSIRPQLIRRAGKTILAGTYDGKGMPPIITILGIGDIRKNDLLAIKDVFTRDELKTIRNKSRTGRSAYDIYFELSNRLSHNAPLERNKFAVSHAVKDTRMEKGLKQQISSQNTTNDIFGNTRRDASKGGVSQKYSEMMQDPNSIDMLRRQVKRKRSP